MDPHEFSRQQGQVAGTGSTPEEAPDAGNDLMDLLIGAFGAAGHLNSMSQDGQEAVASFAEFSNKYLAGRRVVSTGVVDGEFSLVFEDGQAIPLASEEQEPARPDSTVPITYSRETKMKGMVVVDTSVPMTTGNAGSPVRRSSR